MAIRSRENSIGAWAFLIGIILSVITGIFARGSANPIILLMLMALGLLVGYFVSEKEAQTFLLASVAALLASFAGIQGFAANLSLTGISFIGIGNIITSILNSLLFFFMPATIMAAIKTVFSIAKV